MTIIERFEVVPLAIRYPRPCAGGKGGIGVSFGQVNPVYVRLWSRDGVAGFGYAKAFNGQYVGALARLIETLAGRVVGRDARSVVTIGDELRFQLSHAGNHGLAQYALAAVETALWDVKAKAVAQPLFRLLGGERTAIPVYANHLLWRNWTPDELVADSQALVAQGLRAIKMNAGRVRVEDDIARIRLVRDTVGPDIAIHVDANWSWEYAEALRFTQLAAGLDLAWIEDPLRSDNPWELAQLAAQSPVPVAAGELMTDAAEVRAFLDARATRHLQLDLQYMGGVTGWLRGANVADTFGVKVASHLFHDVSAHLASAARNVQIVEYMNWWDVLYEEPLPIHDGNMLLPEASGLGLALSEPALRRFAFEG